MDDQTPATIVHVPLARDLLYDLEFFIAGHEFQPSRVEVIRFALREFLSKRLEVSRTEK
jgi:metal-responsive CopG/Arc/MetJ family transcriptional regulator